VLHASDDTVRGQDAVLDGGYVFKLLRHGLGNGRWRLQGGRRLLQRRRDILPHDVGEVGVEGDVRPAVVAAAAVARGGEDGQNAVVVQQLVALGHALVRAHDEADAVVRTETLGHVGAEEHTRAAIGGRGAVWEARVAAAQTDREEGEKTGNSHSAAGAQPEKAGIGHDRHCDHRTGSGTASSNSHHTRIGRAAHAPPHQVLIQLVLEGGESVRYLALALHGRHVRERDARVLHQTAVHDEHLARQAAGGEQAARAATEGAAAAARSAAARARSRRRRRCGRGAKVGRRQLPSSRGGCRGGSGAVGPAHERSAPAACTAASAAAAAAGRRRGALDREQVREGQRVKGGLEHVVEAQAELRVQRAALPVVHAAAASAHRAAGCERSASVRWGGAAAAARARGGACSRDSGGVLVEHLAHEAARDVLVAALVVAAVQQAARAAARARLARVQHAEGHEAQHDLHAVAAAVHEVAVPQVPVGRRGHAVQREDGVQVLQLAVRVPADGQTGPRLHRHGHEGRQLGRVLRVVAHDAQGVLVVQQVPAPEGLQHGHDALSGQREGQVDARILWRDRHPLRVALPLRELRGRRALAHEAHAQRAGHEPLPPREDSTLIISIERVEGAPGELRARLALREGHAHRGLHARGRLRLGRVQR